MAAEIPSEDQLLGEAHHNDEATEEDAERLSALRLVPDGNAEEGREISTGSTPLRESHGSTLSRRASTATFVTARSMRSSIVTFHTTKSTRSSMITFRTALSDSPSVRSGSLISSRSSWYNLLDSAELIPKPLNENNWSGRGEHAEFKPNEKSNIDAILTVEGVLATSATALVESVRCRRVLLAHKTITCSRRMKRSEALEEVKHLKRLEHSHVVRVVGTYTFKHQFAILLYPAADYNLETFMESIMAESPGKNQEKIIPKLRALVRFFGCLSHALNFLHQNFTKHKDIKPKNLLVKSL